MDRIYPVSTPNFKYCRKCKSSKLTTDFNKSKRNGLRSSCRDCEKKSRTYIVTICTNCGEEKARRKDMLSIWNGVCRTCSNREVVSRPEVKNKKSKNASKQLKKQGGVPNAKKFTSERVRGAGNNKWKGGITPQNVKERTSKNYLEWRRNVFIRDNFTCLLCGQKSGYLQAHHKKEWANFKELRYEVSNGATLCEKCHLNKAHNGSWKNKPVEWDILIKQ